MTVQVPRGPTDLHPARSAIDPDRSATVIWRELSLELRPGEDRMIRIRIYILMDLCVYLDTDSLIEAYLVHGLLPPIQASLCWTLTLPPNLYGLSPPRPHRPVVVGP